MTILIGVDIGQRTEPSGLCVVATEARARQDGSETHYLVRRLERLRAGTSFPALADRVGEVCSGAAEKVARPPRVSVYVNATGLGQPVVDLFRPRTQDAHLMAVYFNHGDRRTEASREIQLGKAYLVARLQTLLQSGCLHLPRTPEYRTLAQDLKDYEIRVDENANERYGAFRVGGRDELVTALGLACQHEPPTSCYD